MFWALNSTKSAGMGHVKVTGEATEEACKMTDGIGYVGSGKCGR